MLEPYPLGISILICTYNGAARLTATLSHLARQVLAPGISWEILLVDNNSNDDTSARSLAHWNSCGAPVPLHLLHQPKPGKQFALEMAYDAARYEFMCIVDDDNWLHEGYLQRGFDLLQSDPTIGLLGGCNTGAFESPPPAWFPIFQTAYAVGEPIAYLPEGRRKLATGEVVAGVLWGAGLFVRHTIWRKLRTLQFKSLFTGRQGEKQLTAGEDDELCHMTRLLGYKLWYDDSLRATHYMTAGRLDESYLKRLYYASSRAYPGLSAYQRALATDEGAKYYKLTPWLKDWAYMLIWAVRDITSWPYLKSYFRSDLQTRLSGNQRILTWYYFTTRFRNSRQDFLTVIGFRNRMRQLYPDFEVIK